MSIGNLQYFKFDKFFSVFFKKTIDKPDKMCYIIVELKRAAKLRTDRMKK